MPARPDVASVIRVDLHGHVNEAPWNNHLFFQYAGSAPSSGDLVTLANVVMSSWGPAFASAVSAHSGIDAVTITDLTSATAAQGTSTHAAVPGTGAFNAANALSLVIQQKIGRRYRGGHSRVYIAGPDADQVQTDGTWLPVYGNGFVTAWESLIGDIVGAPWTGATSLTPVNVGYYHGHTNVLYPSGYYRAVPTPLASPNVDPILSYHLNPKPGSQRRRDEQSA